MKIVFFGNADFGLDTLKSLIASNNHEVIGIVTNEDKKIGRNKKIYSTPIKKIAIREKILLFEIDKIDNNNFLNNLQSLNADLFLVIAYKIISEKIYSMPRYGAINLHASLLPEYRGPAPIERCLIDNRKRTGLSSFFINSSIDKGRLIYQKKILVSQNDTFYDLWKKLSTEGAVFIKETLKLVKNNQKKLTKETLFPSYAPKIDKKELLINWNNSAEEIYHKIRAFSPYPGAYTYYKNKRVKLFGSKISNNKVGITLQPGHINYNKPFLQIGTGSKEIIIVKNIQIEGKKRLPATQYILGHPEIIGEKFE